MNPPPSQSFGGSSLQRALDGYLASHSAEVPSGPTQPLDRHSSGGSATLDPPAGDPLGRVERPLSVVGDFQILGEVGRGGMGVVLGAVQLSLGRMVALKVLSPPLRTQPSARARFAQEVECASMLHHTHILPVYAVVREGETTSAYAMPLIDGVTLSVVLRGLREGRAGHPVARRILTLYQTSKADYYRTAAEWCRQVALALEMTHLRQIVHRDVKPGNLLLEFHGDAPHVWLHDYGLAERVGAPARDAGGTRGYQSPEQAAGLADHAQPAADIYSLGVTLFELLALRRPAYPEEPRAIRRVEPAVPAGLERLIRKATDPHRDRRYPSAAAMAEDLRRFLAGHVVRAGEPRWQEYLARWASRHRAALLASLASFLLAVLVAGGLLVQAYRQERAARREAESLAALASDGVNTFPPSLDDLLYVTGGMEATHLRLLERSVRVNHELLKKRPHDVELQKQLAQVEWRLARMYRQRGRMEEAEELGLASLRRYERIRDEDPADLLHWLDVARGLNELQLTVNSLRPTDFTFEFQMLDTLARAGQIAAIDGDVRFHEAHASYLSDTARMLGDPARALPYLERAMREVERCRELAPRDWTHQQPRCRILANQVSLHALQGDLEAALETSGRVVRAIDALLESGKVPGLNPPFPEAGQRYWRFHRTAELRRSIELLLTLNRDAQEPLERFYSQLVEAKNYPKTWYSDDMALRDRGWFELITLARQGRLDEATRKHQAYAAQLEEAIAKNPGNRGFILHLLECLAVSPLPQARDPQRVLQLLPQVAGGDDPTLGLLAFRLISLARLGRWDEVAADLPAESAPRAANGFLLDLLRAVLAARRGDFEQAADFRRRATSRMRPVTSPELLQEADAWIADARSLNK